MVVSVLSPCCQCGTLLPGVHCGPHQRSRCVKFLAYIQQLNHSRAHSILIKELKDFVNKQTYRR